MSDRLSRIGSEPLVRNFIQGTAQSKVAPIADFIAPAVEVAEANAKYKEYTAKSRFRIPDTVRGLHASAVQVGFDQKDKRVECEHHAIDYPIDILETYGDQDIRNLLMEGSEICSDIAVLVHEKTVVDTAVAAAGAATAIDTANVADLIDSIDQKIISVLKSARYGSLMSVGLVFGANAWRLTKNSKDVKARYGASVRGKNTVNPGETQVGELFLGNPEIRKSFMVVDSGGVGEADDIDFILDNQVLVFARRATPTRLDPSFMKTFRLRGQWMKPGSYSREDGRGEVAKMDWSEDVKVTNTEAVELLTLS